MSVPPAATSDRDPGCCTGSACSETVTGAVRPAAHPGPGVGRAGGVPGQLRRLHPGARPARHRARLQRLRSRPGEPRVRPPGRRPPGPAPGHAGGSPGAPAPAAVLGSSLANLASAAAPSLALLAGARVLAVGFESVAAAVATALVIEE